MRLAFALAALLPALAASGTAIAAPTYLDCTFPDGRAFGLTLDAEKGTARAVVTSTGTALRLRDVAFGPNKVRMTSGTGAAVRVFTVDRSTLALTVELPAISMQDATDCELEKAPEDRKF